MSKMSVTEFEQFIAGADEHLAICTKAKLLKERHIADRMIEIVDKRLEYLEFINPENCVRRAKALEQ